MLLAEARRRLLSPSGSGRVMSRQEVADAANAYLWSTYGERGGLDRNYLGKLEQGKHRWPRARHREALRHVLRASKDADLGFYIIRASVSSSQRGDAGTVRDTSISGEEESEVNRRELFRSVGLPSVAALVAAVSAPRIIAPSPSTLLEQDLVALHAQLARVRHAYQHSQYETAARELPALLSHLAPHRGPASAALAAEAHQVASGLLLKSEQPVLAAIAAERSMQAARDADDALTTASSARAIVHCFTVSGHSEHAAGLAASAADQLAQSANLDEAATLSVYGALLLRGAIAAARSEDHDHAEVLLDEAHRAAQHLGGDHNLHWTAFGPTNVLAHRVAVAVDLGDAGSAVRLARTVDISQLAVPERKAMLLLDTARALSQWGKCDRAFEAIRQAERHAPEEVRRRPAVHSLIHELERRTTGPLRKQLHDYALAVGAAA
jgi:hypothetical protein